ncbi:MAG: hypothetical protein IJY42_03485, partial [Clostridia bacterium]|nr:hypothetical protein [Clostridia bacterium]
ASFYYQDKTCRNIDMTLFATGKSLLIATTPYMIGRLQDTALAYGLLVAPKLNETDSYRSTVYGISVMAIPSTAKESGYSMVVLDAMNWLSGNVSRENGGLGDDNLIDTFYGTVLTGTVANSPQDMSMLTLAREHLYVEFEWLNLSAPNDLRGALTKGQTIDDAKVAEIAAIVDSQLVDIMQFYQREI